MGFYQIRAGRAGRRDAAGPFFMLKPKIELRNRINPGRPAGDAFLWCWPLTGHLSVGGNGSWPTACDDDRFIKQAYQSPGRSVSFLPPTCSRLPGTGASILLAYGQWDLTKAFLVLGGSCLLVPAALAGRASCRSPPGPSCRCLPPAVSLLVALLPVSVICFHASAVLFVWHSYCIMHVSCH